MGRKPGRLRIAMDPLPQILEEAIGQRSVQEVADVCRVPYWVIRDVLLGKTRCPRPDYLMAIAAGLRVPYENLVASAYANPSPSESAASADPVTEELAQQEEQARPRTGGRARKAIAST